MALKLCVFALLPGRSLGAALEVDLDETCAMEKLDNSTSALSGLAAEFHAFEARYVGHGKELFGGRFALLDTLSLYHATRGTMPVDQRAPLDGRYEMVKKLGDGWYATGFLATDKTNEIPGTLCIKLLNSKGAASVGAKEQLLGECTAGKRLHAHAELDSDGASRFTKVHDCKADLNKSDGDHYAVYEYGGLTLDLWVRAAPHVISEDALNDGDKVDLVKQLLEALRFLSRLDPPMIHRDMRSSNLCCSRDANGKVALKVIDYGNFLQATQVARQCFTSEVLQDAREDAHGVCCNQTTGSGETCDPDHRMEEDQCRKHLESFGLKSCFYEVPLKKVDYGEYSEDWDSYPCAPPEVSLIRPLKQFEFPASSFDVFSGGLVALELYCGLEASDKLGALVRRDDSAVEESECLAKVPESLRQVVRDMVRAWPRGRVDPERGLQALRGEPPEPYGEEGTCATPVQGTCETPVQIVLERHTSQKFPGVKTEICVDTMGTCVTGCGFDDAYNGTVKVIAAKARPQCGVTEKAFKGHVAATLSEMS